MLFISKRITQRLSTTTPRLLVGIAKRIFKDVFFSASVNIVFVGLFVFLFEGVEQHIDLFFFHTFYFSDMCPRNASYYGNRAATLMMLCRYREALEDSQQAVRLDNSFMKVKTGCL